MSFDTSIFTDLVSGQALTPEKLEAALTAILSGKATEAQIGALLMALEMKGLSASDIYIGAKVMRANMTPVDLPPHITANHIDIVGTGGTGLHTLSISTAAAIVTAAAGAKVAKHGNRAASSLTGTADTLSELGVNLAISPETAARAIDEAGLGFLFAPNHHPAMRHVGPARKALGIRTLFNLLGPLCNPASVRHMLLGVSSDSFRAPVAEAINRLGADHVWVVHGSDGLDEITLTGTTFVSEVKDGKVRDFEITPQDYGLKTVELSKLRGGEPAQNAAALAKLLDGEGGAYRDIVILNSGAALMLAGLVETVRDGIDLAAHAIDDGRAKSTLQKLVEVTQNERA